MPIKKLQPKKAKKAVSVKRNMSLPKKPSNGKILFFSLVLLIGLLITVVVAQQQQISTQYAQTSPTTTTNPASGTPIVSSTSPIFTIAPTITPTITFTPPTVTPTFGCLGTSCVGTITPTVTIVTTTPQLTTTPGVTIILPTNPNGKTPPGFFVSLIHRVANWFSKFIRFGGNPPGNPNIPGTGINPISIGSSSGNTTVVTIGAGRGRNNAIIIYPNGQNKNATGGGNTVPPGQPSVLKSFLSLFTQFFKPKNVPPTP